MSPVSLTFDVDSGDSLCFEIDVIEDDIYEEDQQFVVNVASVSPSSAAVVGTTSSVTKTIRDNQGTYFLFYKRYANLPYDNLQMLLLCL